MDFDGARHSQPGRNDHAAVAVAITVTKIAMQNNICDSEYSCSFVFIRGSIGIGCNNLATARFTRAVAFVNYFRGT